MAGFQHPFQCLRYVKSSVGASDILVASAGPQLYTYNATTGERIDAWPSTNLDSTKNPTSEAAEHSSEQGPPEKRVKLSTEETSDANADQVNQESQKQQSKSTSNSKLPWSEIPILTATSDGKYVIAATLEDKTVRVFELGQDGRLQELKPRIMPKRLCAVAFTKDEQTLICADKHGDVYALPLIPGEFIKSRLDEARKSLAATELTVHSGKNLKTLEQQKQARLENKKQPAKSNEEKNVLNFEHYNVLGHVSVLTDLISVLLGGRSYILTADRDEHIRVSRGHPQAHVIEQFCLGHKSFVSKICVPAWAPELLVSGAGDGELILWDWIQGTIHQRISLGEVENGATVRGIWDLSVGGLEFILVGLEGSPKLLCYTIVNNQLKAESPTSQLSGNLLDVVVINGDTLAVSVDTVHQTGSTTEWKSSPESPSKFLEAFKVSRSENGFKFAPVEDSSVSNLNLAGTSALPQDLNEKQRKMIDDSFYKLSTMKKQKAIEEKNE